MWWWMGRLAAGVALVATAGTGSAQDAATPAAREGLEALEQRLDRAVHRVSLPHAAALFGHADAARAYRLPGYGIVLVLTPRTLPGAPASRPQARKLHVETRPPGAPAAVVVDIDDEGVEIFERQVLVLQQESEAARRAAEEEMERIVRDVRVRVAPPPAPEAPAPPPVPEAPAPPPWKFWFEAGTSTEARAPEAVVADVRASLIEALTTQGETPRGLAGEERVTVAVDFVRGGLFAANMRPERTLVVSVRARDVAARARASISAEELRRRVEVTEY